MECREGGACWGSPLGLATALIGPWFPDESMLLEEDIVQCVPCPLSMEAKELGANPLTEVLCR